MAKILVTGAVGYVGAHTVKVLHNAGHEVYAVDFHCRSSNDISKYCIDIQDFLNLAYDNPSVVYLDRCFDAVVHLASYISPAESMDKPSMYYTNNIKSTLNMLRFNYNHFIFASTGSAFDPVSPYSKSKVMCEQIIKDHCKRYDKDFTIFRFFNVAGNDGEFGQTINPIHIMKRAAMAAAGKLDKFTIFGNDYDTRDGTCVRDYIHPEDIATSILACLDDPANTDYECLAVKRNYDNVFFNECQCGYSNGEIIEIMKEVSGVDFPVEYGPRREGDAPVFIVDKVSRYLKVKHTIEDMCRQEFELEKKNEN